MSLILLVALLLFLFYLIGLAADVVVDSARVIGLHLRWPIFWLGLAIGLVTSLPELMVGLQALPQGAELLSFGNLTGGVIVLLGLVTGLTILWRGEIATNHDLTLSELIGVGAVIILPVALAFDGRVSAVDGVILVLSYLLVAIWLAKARPKAEAETTEAKSIHHSLWLMVIGVLGLAVLSRLIIKFSLEIAGLISLSEVVVGWIILAVGTNLPEITLAIKASKRQARNLSLGNLLGSAMANTLVMGVLAFQKEIVVALNNQLILLGVFTLLVVGAFIWFSLSGKKITRAEGFVLMLIYLAFLGSQLFLSFQ